MWGSYSKIGGGATGTIRPSTSPRMPTSGFEVRGRIIRHRSPGFARVHFVVERRGQQFADVRQRSPALLSALLSKWSIVLSVRSGIQLPGWLGPRWLSSAMREPRCEAHTRTAGPRWGCQVGPPGRRGTFRLHRVQRLEFVEHRIDSAEERGQAPAYTLLRREVVDCGSDLVAGHRHRPSVLAHHPFLLNSNA